MRNVGQTGVEVKAASSTFSSATGDGYELQMGRFARVLAPKFIDFVELADSGQLLDAGCGTGALSTEVLQRTQLVEVIGVDISAAYAAHANATISNLRASFSQGDLTDLRFDDHSFDQVMSQLVLMFVPDAEKAVRELVRVTKPGGTVSATIWDFQGGLMFMRFVYDIIAMIGPNGEEFRQQAWNRPLVHQGELGRAWRAAGLVDCREGEITIRTNFESFFDYWQPFDGEDGPVPAYLRKITKDDRQRIKDAIQCAYLCGAEDGPRSYIATSWVVVGTKPS